MIAGRCPIRRVCFQTGGSNIPGKCYSYRAGLHYRQSVIAGAGTVLRSEKVAGFHIGVAKCLKNATIRTGFLPYSIYEKVNFVNLQYSTCSGKTQLFISVAGLENLVILYGFFF